MRRVFLFLGSFFGFTAVLAGAFGAHALRAHLSPDLLSIFDTGVRYQFFHAFALLICSFLSQQKSSRLVTGAGLCFIAGTILFSGSLYILICFNLPFFGMVTPLGGVGFLMGWFLLMLYALNTKSRSF